MIYVKTVTKEGNGVAFKLENLTDLLIGLNRDKNRRYDEWFNSDKSEPCKSYGYDLTHIQFNEVGDLTTVKFEENRVGGLFE
jgi:hypothetical protein